VSGIAGVNQVLPVLSLGSTCTPRVQHPAVLLCCNHRPNIRFDIHQQTGHTHLATTSIERQYNRTFCCVLPVSLLQDWTAAVQYVRTQLSSSVDSSRMCLWGTSFAGGHVLAVAHQTPGITAIVSQVQQSAALAAEAAGASAGSSAAAVGELLGAVAVL
jgi:dienelactone hydrolase